MEKVPEAVWLQNSEGKILEANEKACELLERESKEIIDKKVQKVVPETDKILPPRKGDGSNKDTLILRTKTKKDFPIELKGELIEGGEELLVIARRLKEQGLRKKSEQESIPAQFSDFSNFLDLIDEGSLKKRFRKALELQEVLFEGSRDGIFISDAEANFVAVNSAACELTGYDREELLEMKIPDLHEEKDLQAFNEYFDKIMSGENVLSTAKILRKDGRKITTEFNNNRIEIDGEPYMHTSARDITERKEAERKLRKSDQRFRIFLNSTSDLVFLKDENFSHVMVNDAYLEFLGMEREEVVGKTDFELLPTELAESCRESDKRAIREGKAITAEERSGEKVFESLKFPVQLDEDTTGVGGIIRNVTERKQTEQTLNEEREKLKHLHDAVDELQQQDTEEEVTQTTVNTAEKILDFEVCAISLLEGDYLVPKTTSTGLKPDETTKFKVGEGITGKTVQKGETIWGNNLSNYSEAKPTKDAFKSFISIPIGELGNFQVVSKEEGSFDKQDVELAEILVGHLQEEIKRVRLQKELRQQAIKDPLTGLYNRRYLNETLPKEIEKSDRYDKPIAFLMMDVNRFKEINDRYSHQTGDKVLQEVARLLKENVRNADTVFRYGGDEFLIMMPETDGEVNEIAERLNEEMAEWSRKSSLLDFQLTLAMGASDWAPEQKRDVEDALKEADRKMYENKKR